MTEKIKEISLLAIAALKEAIGDVAVSGKADELALQKCYQQIMIVADDPKLDRADQLYLGQLGETMLWTIENYCGDE